MEQIPVQVIIFTVVLFCAAYDPSTANQLVPSFVQHWFSGGLDIGEMGAWMLTWSGFVRTFSVTVMSLTFLPTLKPLWHHLGGAQPLAEAVAYIVSFWLLTNGFHQPKSLGAFSGATLGFGIALPMYVASFAIHENDESLWGPVSVPVSRKGTVSLCANVTFFLWATLLTLKFSSKFFGYLSAAAFFSLVGFTVICTGFCYAIGFRTEADALSVRDISSGILTLVTLAGVFHVNVPKEILVPYTTLSAVTYFLVGLVETAAWSDDKRPYMNRQILYLLQVGIATFIGSFLNLTSLYNTSCVFATLFVIEKTLDFIYWSKHVGSVFVFALALYLSSGLVESGFLGEMIMGRA